MRLIYVDDYNNPSECTVAEAVQNECDSNIEDVGITENTAENVTSLSRAFGLLVQHMYEKGFVDSDFLLTDILQGGYEPKEE